MFEIGLLKVKNELKEWVDQMVFLLLLKLEQHILKKSDVIINFFSISVDFGNKLDHGLREGRYD